MPRLRFNLGLRTSRQPITRSIGAVQTNAQNSAFRFRRGAALVILIGMSHYGWENLRHPPLSETGAEHDTQNLTLLLTLAHSCLLSRQYQCVLDAFHRIVALNAESAEADMLVAKPWMK